MRGSAMTTRRLLTVREVAELLRVDPAWLKRRRRDGLSPRPVRLGRHVRYEASEIDAFVAGSRQ